MSKMKDRMIDIMNKTCIASSAGPDDTDWDYKAEQLDPPPTQIDTYTGKKMWEIKGYKIWAHSYKQALELLPMIENF